MNTHTLYRAGLVAVVASFLVSSMVMARTPGEFLDRLAERKEVAQIKLQDAKLRSCQAREKAIKKRSESLARMAKNMQEKFDAIVVRVQNYYMDIVMPSGKVLDNYDNLMADIATKKTTVNNALVAAQNALQGFSCAADSPKEMIGIFNVNMQSVKQALKNYRASIQNLIMAVRSANSENR